MFVQGGKEIPNYGERTLTLSTLDWSSIRNVTFQVTDVTKALGSVSKIVANGNKVDFQCLILKYSMRGLLQR